MEIRFLSILTKQLLHIHDTQLGVLGRDNTANLHSSLELHELGGTEADKLRRLPGSLVLDKLPPFDDRISAISLILRTTANGFCSTNITKVL